MKTLFTQVSQNAKTGPIPVTITEKASCWTGCALYEKGCYAFYGALGHFWSGVSEGTRGGSWEELCAKVAALPKRTLWRYAQAGDLPGTDDAIDKKLLRQLVIANRGKRVIAFTHKPVLPDTAVATTIDNSLFMTRTEVHCAACGGQLKGSVPNCCAYSVFRRCQPPNCIASPPAICGGNARTTPCNRRLWSMKPTCAWWPRTFRSGKTGLISLPLPHNSCGKFWWITPATSAPPSAAVAHASWPWMKPRRILCRWMWMW